MDENINFFYSIKPIYLYQKVLGLIPFSIDLNDPNNVIQISKWNILYTTFVSVFITFVISTNFWLDIKRQGDVLFKISEHLTRSLVYISAIFTLILNIIRARGNFNLVIKKIVLVDKLIWHHELTTMYRGNRRFLIKIMLIYLPLEYGFILANMFLYEHKNKEFLAASLMYTLDIINTAIII